MMSNSICRFLEEMTHNGTVVICGYRSKGELLAELSAAIEDGKQVAFVPSRASLRHFFNTQGFIDSMKGITEQLQGAENIVPPDLYGQQHVVAFRPLRPTVAS